VSQSYQGISIAEGSGCGGRDAVTTAGGAELGVSSPFAFTLALRADVAGGGASERVSIEVGRGRVATAGGVIVAG